MNKTYIIAEIGINHNGCIDTAKSLIDVAKNAGCDVVKFQKRNPYKCIPEDQKYKPKIWNNTEMTYLDYKLKIEFEKNEYDEINEYCMNKNIKWSASPWDIDSLMFLNNYDIPFIKIPSALITNIDLLEESVKTGKKIIISTGMSTQEEIENAVSHLIKFKSKYNNNNKFSILHCNSTYPAPICELNLACIPTLKSKFSEFEIGYSGHENELITTISSIYLGASIIERHITLNKNSEGSDHKSSLNPTELETLVKDIRTLESAIGNGILNITNSQLLTRQKLRKI